MKYIAVILFILCLTSCGRANGSGGYHAEAISVNLTGYTCFVISDSAGAAVGGSCVVKP